MDKNEKSFWAITSYFNPCGYQRRLHNYKIFRKFLNVPLVTVELSFDGNFELKENDADILVQIKGNENNIMWQKERLLNLALTYLPEKCDKVAWLDCDIIFGNEDWVNKASKLLDKYNAVQLFKKVIHLPQNFDIKWENLKQLNQNNSYHYKISWIYNHVSDQRLLSPRRNGGGFTTNGNPGMAWAAKKELLQKYKLYDASIIGSADRLLICALTNNYDWLHKAIDIESPQKQHYLAWAKSIFPVFKDIIFFLDTNLFHLWHGNLNNRHYKERHNQLKKFNFNPYTDIILDDNGCWKWNSHKPELHQYLKDYFYSRKEDEQ